MGDDAPAPGWWKASDGRWYPPQAATPAGDVPGSAFPDAVPPADDVDDVDATETVAVPPVPPAAGDGTETVVVPPIPPAPGDGPGAPPPPPPGGDTDATAGANRKLLVGLGVAALVVLAVVVFTQLGGGDEDGQLLGEERVADDVLLDALAEGEALMDDAATREGANRAQDAACFLSKASEDAAEINSLVRCGPVLFLDAPSVDARWMTGDLFVSEDAEGTTVASVSGLAKNTTLTVGEHLFRPDGREPSTDELTLPDPPPVPAGYLEVLEEEPGVVLEPFEGDARLAGVDYELVLLESALVDRIGVGPEALIPPSGEQFVVVRYELLLESGFGSQVQLALDIDGAGRSFDSRAGTFTVVAAVDAAAEEIAITVQDSATNQSVSVLTGERALGYPEVLYRTRTERLVAVNDSTQVAYTAIRPGYDPASGVFELGVGEAALVWSDAETDLLRGGTLPRPSDPGDAWLVVEVNRFAGQSEVFWAGARPDLSPQHLVLTLADDTEVQADAGLSNVGTLVFAVPADLTTATLSVRPGDGIPAGNATYNFGATTGAVEITFREFADDGPDDPDDDPDDEDEGAEEKDAEGDGG